MTAAVNGDFTSLDYYYGSSWCCQTCTREGKGRAPIACPFCLSEADASHGALSRADAKQRAIETGLEKLRPHLVPDFDGETGRGCNIFSSRACDCCQEWRSGSRYNFAILGAQP